MRTEDLRRWALAEARLARVRQLLAETADDALLEQAARQVRDARWN